jgi:hydrogenase maturation protein HypF
VWGCEFLDADLRSFERVAHLRYASMPGGDLAARAPWRAFLAYASLDDWGEGWADTVLDRIPGEELAIARQQIRRGVNAPLESSMGRLFDAAAALLGLRVESAYEAQAAMQLEAIAASGPCAPLPFPVLRTGALPVLDPLTLLQALATERLGGATVPELAARFHESVAFATAELASTLCRERGLRRVALGGGCFQNELLLRSLRRHLQEKELEVLTPVALGPNDGAISYGQAVVAAARMAD